MRIADEHGHLWPVTGHTCPTCGMPADATLDGQPHPTCSVPIGVPLPSTPPDTRACTDCGEPLPATAGRGILVHLRCWKDRPRPGTTIAPRQKEATA